MWKEYCLICRFGKRTVCSYHSEIRRITVSEVSHILSSLLLTAVSGARQDEAMPSGCLRRDCPSTLLLMCAHSALLSPVLKTNKRLFLNIRTNGLTLSDASTENTLWSVTEHKTQMDWCMYYASTENKQKSVPEHVRLKNVLMPSQPWPLYQSENMYQLNKVCVKWKVTIISRSIELEVNTGASDRG